MKLLTTPFLPGTLMLTLMLPGLVLAAPEQVSPLERAAKRATVVAYARQKLERQEIASDQLKQVQGLGQALLASQASMQPAPVDEALRQEIKVLREEIDRVLEDIDTPRHENIQSVTARFSTAIELPVKTLHDTDGRPVGGAVASAKRPGAKVDNKSAAADAAFEPRVVDDNALIGVRGRLSSLRTRIDAAAAHADSARDTGGVERSIRTKQLAAKATELQQEAKTLIEGRLTPEKRMALSRLRDRLEEKKLPAIVGEQNNNEAPTPTITTIVRHR